MELVQAKQVDSAPRHTDLNFWLSDRFSDPHFHFIANSKLLGTCQSPHFLKWKREGGETTTTEAPKIIHKKNNWGLALKEFLHYFSKDELTGRWQKYQPMINGPRRQWIFN